MTALARRRLVFALTPLTACNDAPTERAPAADLDEPVGNEAGSGRDTPSQLFRNNQDGTFTDVARDPGVDVVAFVKGVTWGDYDGDQDLYVSVMGAGNRLFRNDPAETPEGRRVTDVTERAGVRAPAANFVVWLWDYDNDGWLDLHVAGYRAQVGDIAAEIFDRSAKGEFPRLYRNQRNETFVDMPRSAFEEVTVSGGFGHIQLEGVSSNRAALGARVRATVIDDGVERTVYAHVSGGSSFGANSLQLEIGLGNATSARPPEITWPTSGRAQRFSEVGMDSVYRVSEDRDELQRLESLGFTLCGGSGMDT
jgi:hypothetical protein